MKSVFIQDVKLEKEKSKYSLDAKPVGVLSILFLIGLAILFNNMYGYVGIFLIMSSIFLLFFFPNKPIIDFKNDHLLFYCYYEKKSAYKIYYDEIDSYEYYDDKIYDTLLINLKNGISLKSPCIKKKVVLEILKKSTNKNIFKY